MDNDKGANGFKQAVLYRVDQILPVGEQCIETGVVVLIVAEGEYVRGLALQPLVQLAVGEFKRLLDMELMKRSASCPRG